MVGKGRTSRPSEVEEWTREYYEIEVLIEDPAELEVAKANLTGLIDGWLSKPKLAPQPKKALTVEEVEKAFPQELKALLTFTVSDDGSITVTPRQFLGAENFAKIADVVRSLGGEYVSAGKNSHFKIPPKG